MNRTLTDEDFARDLRARVDDVAPDVVVHMDRVVPEARRRRARRSVVTGVASVALVTLATGWAVSAQPWAPVEVAPADAPLLVAPHSADTETDPSARGWPQDAFWYVRTQNTSVGQDGAESVEARETWSGRTEPGLFRTSDEEDPGAFGPALWGVLKVDGEWAQIGWEGLYALPTDAEALESVLRDSVEPGRGAGTPDDKVLDMAVTLLAGSPAPPPLRDAVWDVMTGLPEAKVVAGAEDSLGRVGVRLRYETPGAGRLTFVYDPVEPRLLEASGSLWENPGDADDSALFSTSWRTTYLNEYPTDDTPVEPTLEMAGCVRWETC